MKILELFAGSRSFGNLAESMGHEVFSVDWHPYKDIKLCMDIGLLTPERVPFIPDAIWLSPDCTSYSIAGIRFHRINAIEPISNYAKKCDTVNQHVIALLKHWLTLNPNMVYFIENPRGMLRKMPFMQEFKRHTVWYCQYGDKRAKPTDIWTNSKTWVPRVECHNGNKDCHHESSPRGSKNGTQSLKNSYDRSKIPTELCKEIIESITMTSYIEVPKNEHETNDALPEPDYSDEYEANQPYESCPNCGETYDDADFDFQICHHCGYNVDVEKEIKPNI